VTPTVVDTSVLIDVLRGSTTAVAWFAGLDEVPTCSEVTRVEVLQGVRSAERAPTERLLQTMRWMPVDESVSRSAGDLGRRYRHSHKGIGVADLIIAATCIETGSHLATMNTRHFPMFEPLVPPYLDVR
jgi:predicted nucleic acid-binding protein